MGQQLLEFLLKQHWTEKVPGRWNPVPEPYFYRTDEVKKHDLSQGDAVYIKDGGVASKEAAGLGWSEERKEVLVTLDCRTIKPNGGRVRLEGERDPDTLEKEDYGGLVGECERILDLHRKDTAEYQLVEGYEINDLSENQGFGRFRADIEVRLHTGPYTLNVPESDTTDST